MKKISWLLVLGMGLAVTLQAMTVDAAEPTTRTVTREALRARHTMPDSKFMDVDGINVHYKDEGSGPVILLVHGTFGDLTDWDEWAKVLKTQYRVIRPDLPAFGMTSAIANGNYSVDRVLTLIDGFMDQLKVEKFAMAGVSYGGLVTFRYAATRTDRVTAMILMNSAGIEYGKGPANSNGGGDKPAAPQYNITTDPRVTEQDVQDVYKHVLSNPGRMSADAIRRKTDYFNVIGRDEEGIIARKQYERGNPQRVLAHVRAPTLVIWGGANKALSNETANRFIEALTSASAKKLILDTEGGHMLNLDRPEATVAHAREFLATYLK